MFDFPGAEEITPTEDETEETDAGIRFDGPRPALADDDWNED
jgi:hypothetical protein